MVSKLIRLSALGALVLGVAACTKVPAGHVGIKAHLSGSEKGEDIKELGAGDYWNGFNEELFLFPTSTQNYTYTESERIGFQTKEGLMVSADIGITYHIAPDNVSEVFRKYRKGLNEITQVFLRNMVRDALVKEASTLPIESVYGSGKNALIGKVFEDVQAQAAEVGITVEKLHWTGELHLPQDIVDSINLKIQAAQLAEQRENEVRQAIAEAKKVTEAAKGEAAARLAVAQAEATAIRLKGQAINDFPQVAELNAIERWNGKLPHLTVGEIPLLNIVNPGLPVPNSLLPPAKR